MWKGPNGAQSVSSLRTYTGVMKTVRPAISLGRGFTADEEGGAPVVLLSDAFWRRHFAASPDVLDRTLDMSGAAYRVIGVLAPSVGYPDDAATWIPAPRDLQNGSRAAGYLGIVARLRPGVSIHQAQAEAGTVAQRLSRAYPDTDAGLQATLVPLRERVSREARTPLYVLLSVVACVLVMICLNVSALLLSRGGERQRGIGPQIRRSALVAATCCGYTCRKLWSSPWPAPC